MRVRFRKKVRVRKRIRFRKKGTVLVWQRVRDLVRFRKRVQIRKRFRITACFIPLLGEKKRIRPLT